jgi:hypothetical protein
MAELPKENPLACSAFYFDPIAECVHFSGRGRDVFGMYSMITIGQVLQTKGHDFFALSASDRK